LVRIHCYGCNTTVSVEEAAMSQGLERAGWALAKGETFCPSCASERQLSVGGGRAQAPDARGAGASAGDAGRSLEPFAASAVLGERRGQRAMRLLRASFSVLREDPQLLVFPAVALGLTLVLGALSLVLSISHSSGTGTAAAGSTRDAIFIVGLVVAYPITFVSLYCGVALAAVLAGRLDGEQLTVADGWMAARERAGLIAAWTLLACTVGAVLRLIERYVPLGARILVAIVGLSWTLATMFAVPVLAYENLGPRQTLRRSRQIFTQRWGTQIGGIVGISVASVFMYAPFVVLVLAGVVVSGVAGTALAVLGSVGFVGAIAVQMALDQIFRVFVYRNAVGLDTKRGPFSQDDLQAPFASRRGR
jgi:Family of unknown function (DUF6159)